MAAAVIRKGPWPRGVVPNVVDLDAEQASFTWDAARRRLDGLPGGAGLNIAHEAVDRHAAGPRADRVALRWLRRDGTVTEATYAELAACFPRSGGIYVFIREGFGPLPAFLFGWAELLVIRPGAFGAISITAAAYTLRLIGVDPAAAVGGLPIRGEQMLAAVYVAIGRVALELGIMV